ncbi:Cobalt-zinc-cadmium resistance protein CzcA [Planctomycetes bacterium Poly30]|uniref:Cobalt-zinc-cadmium resistance protein CzcA n=1 Tax=Saltatorellus ferox TaxID=2528018 RepID=A0A518EM87_9BACT|nr:Cobalt-zinc-cadmium resistance protein CzcA [Planctomycetes bacterium Poly30]
MMQRLVQFALTQRILVVVSAIAIALGGLWAFGRLPIDAFPDISVPQVRVIVKAPGLSPVEVEQRITRPIEIEMQGIPRKEMLRSLTKYALSVVTVDFEEGTDIYWARQQVTERLNQVWGDMPDGAQGGLAPITTPLGEAFMFTVEGEGYTNQELRTVLDWTVRPRLMSVDGVAEVNALGGLVRSFEVQIQPSRMQAFGLSINEVVDAIQKSNRNAGGDRVVRNNEVLLVRTIGQIQSIEDLASISIRTSSNDPESGGVPILVSDVADVRVSSMTRFGGVSKDAKGEHVQGLVLTRLGANSLITVSKVKETLAQIAPSLPPGVSVVPFYDRTDLINRAVTMVRNALGMACALVVLVLLVFMGNLRGAVTVAVVLPMAVLGTFLAMNSLGMTANLMSLGGLVIAIGILVDPAVVVVENIQSQLSQPVAGASKLNLIYRAVLEVATPVVSGTAIIVIVFLPILSLSGLEGRMFAPLAETIVVALIVAVAFALVLIPVLSSLLLKSGGSDENALIRRLKKIHSPLVNWALRHRVLAFTLPMLLLVPTGFLFSLIGGEFIPTLKEGTIVVQTAKLPTISLERSIEMDGRIQAAIMASPEVQHVVSRLGSDELRLDPMGLHESDHYLVTAPESEWTVNSEEELIDQLRQNLEAIPGVSFGFTQPIEMRTSEMMTGVTAQLAVKLFGTDLAELNSLSERIESAIATTPGGVDVKRARLSGQTYLEINMDHTAMARLGLRVEDVNQLIEAAVAGQQVTQVIEGARRTPVMIRYQETSRDSVESLRSLLVDTPVGSKVLLSSIAEILEVDGPVQLGHENSMRNVVIQANVDGRDIVGFVEELKRKIAAEIPMPPGYFVEFGGQFENQQRAAGRLAMVIPLALGLIFLILFSTFRSLRQAFLILANIPFAVIGGVAALYFSGLYMSVPASVGFITLLGTALLNGIVMVSYFNQLRDGGTPLEEAVRQGSARRLRPVLMTAVTTALGLLPILVATGPGSEVQRPLAVVVVGGLITSTIITLVVLPALYASIERRSSARPTAGALA